VPAWLRNSVLRVGGLLQPPNPQVAQDGGIPLIGLLFRVSPELQERLSKEFFLT
jgi:hypothetical protein